MSDANNIASTLGFNVTVNTLGIGTSLLGEINIIALPPDLQNLNEIQSLEGKILSVQKDGLVLISTERGNITISTNTPALLQSRKEIELRIEAGSPPTKVILRPTAHETIRTDTAKSFDVRPVQTTLTESAKTLNAALLGAQQLLSGLPIQMTLFGSEETIAQPFMRNTSTALMPLDVSTFLPLIPSTAIEQRSETADISNKTVSPKLDTEARRNEALPYKPSIVLENSIPTLEHAFYPVMNSTHPFQNEILLPQTKAEAVVLPAQNTYNAASLPFRAIAVQVIGTSNETRISYENAPQAPADAEQSNVKKIAHERISSTTDPITANHAEIRVRNIFPPQVQFTDDVSSKIQSANNLHFTPVQSEANSKNELFSSTIFSSRVGLASAVVEGFTQTHNLPVLRMLSPKSMSERLYALDVPVQGLPMGCQLECEINLLHTNIEKSVATTGAPDKPMPVMSASQFLMPGNWPVMEEIQQGLVQVSAQTAQAFNASLPSASAPAQLGASILFFVAAMHSGDIQSWFGEKAIDALKRSGKGSLLGKVSNELSGLSQINKEKVSGEWRALSIPLIWQNDVHKLVIYTNRGDSDTSDEDDNVGKGRKTRFVVDLSLSHIGPLQLDGLFSGSSGDASGETTGRLDLVLRTEQGFSKAMKQQMRGAYKNALDKTHITGELSFQDHTLDWVRITPGETAEYSTNA